MREVLLSLALLATIKFLFEEGIHKSLLVRIVHALVYLLFIAFAHQVTQHVTRTEIEAALYTPDALRNVSLAVMIDLLYVIYKCSHRPVSRHWWRSWIRHLPPLLFFPALFYIRISLFYLLPGQSFVLVSSLMAALVALLCITAPYIWKLLGFGGQSLREPLVLLSLCSFIFVVAAGVLHPDSAVHSSVNERTDWWQTLWLILIILGMASIGYTLPRLWNYIKSKRGK